MGWSVEVSGNFSNYVLTWGSNIYHDKCLNPFPQPALCIPNHSPSAKLKICSLTVKVFAPLRGNRMVVWRRIHQSLVSTISPLHSSSLCLSGALITCLMAGVQANHPRSTECDYARGILGSHHHSLTIHGILVQSLSSSRERGMNAGDVISKI